MLHFKKNVEQLWRQQEQGWSESLKTWISEDSVKRGDKRLREGEKRAAIFKYIHKKEDAKRQGMLHYFMTSNGLKLP